MRRLLFFAVAIASIGAAGCGAGDSADLIAFEVPGDNPVDGVLWCEPGDLIADLNSTTAFPPNIEVPALPEAEAMVKSEDFAAMVFAGSPAADARLRLRHDGGPTATVTLERSDGDDENDPRPGGWLTFQLVAGEWTVTGYTVCNRFAFGG